MEYRYLGRSGMKVSEVCLGAMTFGREADEATSHRMLDRFAELGGTFVDTADVYGPGTRRRSPADGCATRTATSGSSPRRSASPRARASTTSA